MGDLSHNSLAEGEAMVAATQLTLIVIALSVCSSQGFRWAFKTREDTFSESEIECVRKARALVTDPGDEGAITPKYLLSLLQKLTVKYVQLAWNYDHQMRLVDLLKNSEVVNKEIIQLKSMKLEEMEKSLQECSASKERIMNQEKDCKNCTTTLDFKNQLVTSLNMQLDFCHKNLKDGEELIKSLKSKEIETTSTTETSHFNWMIQEADRLGLHANDCIKFQNYTGFQQLEVANLGLVKILCNSLIVGSGWTVIQRRLDGKTSFFRTWEEYRKGFGDLEGEFFIGLEALHQLTTSAQYELTVHLEDFEGEKRIAEYDNFRVGDEDTSYALMSLGKYSGDAGDGLTRNLYAEFSTYDNDNEEGCATKREGAWWYGDRCGFSNLNGIYSEGDTIYDHDGMGVFWSTSEWHDFSYSLKKTYMMIRPKMSF